jgi:hypothetical protein
MGERRRRSKNAGRICEKHRIVLRSIEPRPKPQIGMKKNEQKMPMKLELRKK